ncbi:hypothetical protein [Micromonospora sonchi]|uniref:hypothetical protein n=1 Tax=Micromonospora sonchi TaxID=1763543 RepID=UPI001E4CFE0A
MRDTPPSVPDFTQWPSFPFEGELRIKPLDDPVPVEPLRKGEADRECTACQAPDDAYIWVGERWRVRAMDRPTGLPMVLILESRSHFDLGDLPNLLAAELGVMTVRLERAIRSLDGVARVHVNRWGDGSAHLHMWFLARPYGRLQLRGTFLTLWDSILPPISEDKWRENLALVAAWLAEFGGRPLAEPHRIQWQAPSSLAMQSDPTEDEVPQGGSLLDAIAETVERADTDASDLGRQSATTGAASTGAPEVEGPSTGAASTAVAAAVPSPRPSPEAEPGLVPGRQDGIAGAAAADPAAADAEREAGAADGRVASTTEANPTARGQASEPKATEIAGDATGPITRSSGA